MLQEKTGGTLQDFIWLDDEEEYRQASYHEASHALRAHSFGVEVKAICLGWNVAHTALDGDPNEHPMWEHAQISLAGPMATLKYLQERPGLIAFRHKECTIGFRENDADLVSAIERIRWKRHEQILSYADLNPDLFYECEMRAGLDGLDDFGRMFDSLMIEHYNRYGRIPRKSTLLRRYREHEEIAREWVEKNWPTICLLGWYILQYGDSTARYTHRLKKAQFYKLVREEDEPEEPTHKRRKRGR